MLVSSCCLPISKIFQLYNWCTCLFRMDRWTRRPYYSCNAFLVLVMIAVNRTIFTWMVLGEWLDVSFCSVDLTCFSKLYALRSSFATAAQCSDIDLFIHMMVAGAAGDLHHQLTLIYAENDGHCAVCAVELQVRLTNVLQGCLSL